MGKKTRKTRWRTLTINDEPSDSEESSTTTAQTLPKSYYPKSYYNKFSYSSQSTPRRRFQHDGTKSTRSSSTASENKITFNEDEYTRITTPRQDVLFKKGYLNKPKNYQTQTSTGTSTTSTGNSTGNGTPDHQSTDLEYESQFVFPNGFVDQNGIYYVNGYESYPLMLYNPPTYYPEFSNHKSKRYSTGSLTESMSPNNEEATSQDLSGGEASNNVSDYSGHHPVYNMIYPGYYVNEVCPPHDLINGHTPTDQTRRIKKRRRRKTSKSQTAQDSSEYTEDDSDSGEEEEAKNHPAPEEIPVDCNAEIEEVKVAENEKLDGAELKEEISRVEVEVIESNTESGLETELKTGNSAEEEDCLPNDDSKEKASLNTLEEERSSSEVHQSTAETTEIPANEEVSQNSSECSKPTKSNLKPDAEEFIPRAYRSSEASINPNLPFLKVPPNFVPIPVLPLGEFNGQNFNPAFIPPGIQINFLPPDPKIFPNFVSFVPNNFVHKKEAEIEDLSTDTGNDINRVNNKETCDNPDTAKDDNMHQTNEPGENSIVQNVNNKTIDIATIVSKLEVAAKEQEDEDAKKTNTHHDETQNSPRRKFSENKYPKAGQKYKTYRRNYYNSPQTSPQKKQFYMNGNTSHREITENYTHEEESEKKLEDKNESYKCNGLSNGIQSTEPSQAINENPEQLKSSPEKIRKNWKHQHFQNGSPKWHQNNTSKDFRRQNGRIYNENETKDYRTNQKYKNYSEMLRNKTQIQIIEPKYTEECVSDKQKSELLKSETNKSLDIAVSPVKKSNQWISVSNRKKRKNKSMEENDICDEAQIEDETEEHSNTELFESYDVNLLVDVVPPSAENELLKPETTEQVVEEITNISESQTQSVCDEKDNTINDEELVRDTPKIELLELDIIEAEPAQESTAELQDITVIETVAEEIVALPEFNPIPTELEATDKTKKKTKKGTQKPLTKRVIITDMDLSMNNEQLKTPVKKVVTKLNETKITPKVEEKHENDKEQTVVEKLPNSNEDEKKKCKKKKKKPSKMITSTSSLSSSNTTINIVDDSYDFLLDSALSDESVEKTNIEVSQELDKLIQKGMYSNLEEKIKSLNIDEADGFFKSIFSTISSRESSVEKTGFAQSPDLSKLLQNTKMCPSSSVSQENNSQNKDINTVLPDLDSPAEDGLFLENSDLCEIPQDRTVTIDTDTEETKTEGLSRDCDSIYAIPSEDAKLGADAETKSYPITQAVKEWMNKTREKTPDVVLLKSPSAIYKEFCESDSESDIEVIDSKTSSFSDKLNTAFADDDVAGGGAEDTRETDSTDIRENYVRVCETPYEYSENDGSNELSKDDRQIEEGEDVMELYESKYGKNADDPQSKKEIREKANSSNYPKQRNTPYRAICCSIV